MRILLGSVRLLVIAFWVGGVAFFALVEAPVTFGMLADTHAAGLVVGSSLRILHLLGLVLGSVFLAVTAAVFARAPEKKRVILGELSLMIVMLGLTAFSQFAIIPRMERARIQNGGAVVRGDEGAAATAFMRLHRLSETLEGVVLLAGVVLTVLMAAETAGDRRMRESDLR